MTISNNKLRELIIVAALSAPGLSIAGEPSYEFDGHVKARVLADAYPGDSIFRELIGSTGVDGEADMRLNFSADKDRWSFDAAWQLYAGHGDRIELSRQASASGLSFVGAVPSDDRRLMNLTDMIRDDGRSRVLHRLDRLSAGYASDRFVLRVGRQAISWGNGLMYSPMDIVNPFDPTIVDTEYKIGDDMVYGQYLFSNGNDLQAAQVFRRNALTGNSESRLGTTAVKYHGILGDGEFDLLVAESYDELTIGFGGNRSIGGAVLRGDLMASDTSVGDKVQFVTNLSYSWVFAGRNMSGVVEYYFNGFGQRSDHYDLALIAQNTNLVERLERGEIFTIGRNYLAGGILIEMSPLWTLTPNLFANLDDGSALFQLTTNYSLGDNSGFLAAFNLPLGPSGTEFGGLNSDRGVSYLSTDLSLFAQFAWYF